MNTKDQVMAPSDVAWFHMDRPDFRLTEHLRFRKLPAPGDVDALRAYASEQAAIRLEQSSALWEVHVLDGFEGGGAILIRIHHAVADGHLVVRLGTQLEPQSLRSKPVGGHLHFRSTQLPLPLPRQPRAKNLSRCFPYAQHSEAEIVR